MKVSILLASLGFRYAFGSKSLTSPAIVDEKDDSKLFVSKFVIFEMPDWPSIILFHELVTPIPTGVTKPSPVITTFLLFMN